MYIDSLHHNRNIARIAKLAGAPKSKAADVDLFVKINSIIEKGQPLFTIHSDNPGELEYALSFLKQGHPIFHVEETV